MRSVYDLDDAASHPTTADAPRRRRLPAVAGCVLAAAIAIVVVRGMLASSAPTEDPVVATTPPAVAVLDEIAEAAPSMAVRSGSPAEPDEPGTVEMCGLGRVRIAEPKDNEMPVDPLADRTDAALARTIARLAAQSDDRSRAAAAFLQAFDLQMKRAQELMVQRQRDGIDCSKHACEDGAESVVATTARDALVRVAVGSQDPWVYALAYHSCSKHPMLGAPGAACQMISVERWTQIEPDNAIPWLYAASEAQKRRDAAAVSEALYRASQAKVTDVRFGHLAAVLRTQEPSDLAPVLGFSLDVRAIGIEAAMALPNYQLVFQHCSKETLRDPNRRGVCEGLAEVLSERSRTQGDAAIGIEIGKRLGWPQARIDAFEERRDAYYAIVGGDAWQTEEGTLKLGCEAVAGQRGWVTLATELGDFGALRVFLEASGETQARLAARHRRKMAQWTQAAKAEAASSATPASAPADGMLRPASSPP